MNRIDPELFCPAFRGGWPSAPSLRIPLRKLTAVAMVASRIEGGDKI
jgi:hypothetical protein